MKADQLASRIVTRNRRVTMFFIESVGELILVNAVKLDFDDNAILVRLPRAGKAVEA